MGKFNGPPANQLYNCTFCWFKYSTIGSLAVYIRDVHVKGLHYCSACGKVIPVRQDFYVVEKHPCIKVHLKKRSVRARLTLEKLPCATSNSGMLNDVLPTGKGMDGAVTEEEV